MPFSSNPVRSGIEIVWARGRYGPDNNEQVGAIIGFTDLGHWAVAWTEEAGFGEYINPDSYPVFYAPVFFERTRLALLYGRISDHDEVRENLAMLRQPDQTWTAVYQGHMTGVAHQHGNSPVGGNVVLNAEFDWLSWVNSVQLSVTDIAGNGFVLPSIQFPVIDGLYVDTPSGRASVSSFERHYDAMYLQGHFAGHAHDTVHGVFSTHEVSGGFGAVQTSSQNRPPPHRSPTLQQ